MTDKELLDTAYRIATSTCLTQEFNYDEFQTIECLDYAWQPFEYLSESEYSAHVAEVADSIFEAMKGMFNE